MERFIARLNIERCHQKFENEADETTRPMLMRLLSEEQAKLVAIIDKSDKIGIRELGFGQA